MANERTFTNDKGVIGEAGEYFPWKNDDGGGSVTPESIVTATGQMTPEQADRTRANINAAALPTVTASDNGKFLRVVSGAWAAATVLSAETSSF